MSGWKFKYIIFCPECRKGVFFTYEKPITGRCITFWDWFHISGEPVRNFEPVECCFCKATVIFSDKFLMVKRVVE